MNRTPRLRFINTISDFFSFIDNKYRNSAIYNYFKSYDKTESAFRNSLFYKIFRIDKCSTASKYFRNNFAKKCEDSIITEYIKRIYNSIFTCSVRAYAVIFLCFSIYSIALNGIVLALGNNSDIIKDNIYSGAILFVCSLPFLVSKLSLLDFVAQSRILSAFFYDLLFVKEKSSEKIESKNTSTAFLIVTGTLMGLFTYFTTVSQILMLFAFVIFVLMAYKKPENSLTVMLLCMPFASVSVLSLLSLVSFAAFFFKFLRGKRNFRLSFFDLMSFLLIEIIFAGSFDISGVKLISTNTLPMIAMALSYFVFVNCIRTEEQIRRCIYTLSFSGGLSAAVKVLHTALSDIRITDIIEKIGVSINFSVITPFGGSIEYGNYMLALIPFMFTSLILTNSKKKQIYFLLASILSLLSMAELHSKGILVALIIAVIIFITSTFRNPASSMAVLLLACLMLVLFILNSPFLGNERFFNFNGYKENIISNTIEIIRDNPLGGIGFGKENFIDTTRVYSHFSEHNIDNCYDFYLQILAQTGVFGIFFLIIHLLMFFKMVFTKLSYFRKKSLVTSLIIVSSLTSICAMCLRGISSFIWQDYRAFALYFIVMAIVSSKYFENSYHELPREVIYVTE